jgi:hypothetical protein
MRELSLSDIDQIRRDVRAQEITFSHLADDLTDHICCDVEHVMQNGLSFAEAYKLVRLKMGSGRRLKEIQEETLFAVDTKYRKMKNMMKVSGIAGTVMLGFASLFKIMHWPMAGVFMTLGAVTLAFLFMPSALGVLWKESHSQKRLFLFISAFIAAMFFILGILFKVQHWPGAGIMISLAGVSAIFFLVPAFLQSTLSNPERKASRSVYIIGAIALMLCLTGFLFKMMHWPFAGILITLGLLVLFAVALPWYVITAYKNETFVRAEFIYIVVGSILILIPAALTVTNVHPRYETGYFANIARETAQFNNLAGTNSSFVAEYADSANSSRLQELHSMTVKVIGVINVIEAEMIALDEGEPGLPRYDSPLALRAKQGEAIDYGHLLNPFNPVPYREILAPGSPKRKDIENAVAEYSNYISQAFAAEVPPLTKSLTNASAFLPAEDGDESKVSMVTALHSLALMKNSVLTAENILLRKLAESKY